MCKASEGLSTGIWSMTVNHSLWTLVMIKGGDDCLYHPHTRCMWGVCICQQTSSWTSWQVVGGPGSSIGYQMGKVLCWCAQGNLQM